MNSQPDPSVSHLFIEIASQAVVEVLQTGRGREEAINFVLSKQKMVLGEEDKRTIAKLIDIAIENLSDI